MEDISRILAQETDAKLVQNILDEILTPNELEMIRQRLKIALLLKKGMPQHSIAKEIKASLCSITRGAKMLKKENSSLSYIVDKYLLDK